MLKKWDNAIFGRYQNHYAQELEHSLQGCESLLDVGCGAYSPIRFFKQRLPHTMGIDAHEPSIERSRAENIHDDYRLMNVMEMDSVFGENSFDAVIASDLIEHLTKEDGLVLLKKMEKVARKKVVIYTPNGFLPQRAYDNNDLQVHLSGWEVDEMKALGYEVTGINGWKPLRGEFAEMRYKPKVLWGRVSLLTQPYTRHRPHLAFAIMCVKTL